MLFKSFVFQFCHMLMTKICESEVGGGAWSLIKVGRTLVASTFVLTDTYLLTDWLTDQPTNYLRGARTRWFITVFTRAHPLSLSWATRIHTSQKISLRFILIQSFDLRLGLPSGSFLCVFPPKPCTLFSPLPCVAEFPYATQYSQTVLPVLNGPTFHKILPSYKFIDHTINPEILASSLKIFQA
jgi:hypothetical protein